MAREWMTNAWLRVKALVNRRRLERDLEEELEFHLAKRAEKNRRWGLAADDAQAAARRRFGNVPLVKEDCRDMWIFTWLETLWRDVCYAARGQDFFDRKASRTGQAAFPRLQRSEPQLLSHHEDPAQERPLLR
jgi:hypothetical protein